MSRACSRIRTEIGQEGCDISAKNDTRISITNAKGCIPMYQGLCKIVRESNKGLLEV